MAAGRVPQPSSGPRSRAFAPSRPEISSRFEYGRTVVAEEVRKLRLGGGEEFRGEGILAITKALLESGVSYVAGYQGAPISHLMDVLTDANDILEELGVHFENSASKRRPPRRWRLR